MSDEEYGWNGKYFDGRTGEVLDGTLDVDRISERLSEPRRLCKLTDASLATISKPGTKRPPRRPRTVQNLEDERLRQEQREKEIEEDQKRADEARKRSEASKKAAATKRKAAAKKPAPKKKAPAKKAASKK
jgi:hypothetical protein